MAIRFTFRRQERLKRKKEIDALFRDRKALSSFPIRVLYQIQPRPSEPFPPAKACFTVPKKKFRKAHDRNRIKRRMREAWRLMKGDFYAYIPEDKQIHLLFIFSGKEDSSFSDIQNALEKAIHMLQQQLRQ